MELRHLRTFIVVTETLNISEAARRLHVTQPALSRHIQTLEDVLGRALFLRIPGPGRLQLTPAGVMLREHGQKALAAVDDAVRTVRGDDALEKPVVRVGYYGTMSVWSRLLAPPLERLSRKYPKVEFHTAELTCAQLAAQLRERKLDVALLGPGEYGTIPGVTLNVACAAPALAMIAVNHRLAKKRLIGIEDLRGEEIIGATPDVAPGREHAVIAACRAAGFTPRLSLIAESLPELMMAVKKRMGVTLVGSLASIVPQSGIVFIKLRPPGVLLELYTGYVSDALPVARELAQAITDEAQRLVARP